MKAIILAIAALCVVTLSHTSEAVEIDSDAARPILLPTPKRVTWLDGRVSLTKPLASIVNAAGSERAVQTGISQLRERVRSLGGAAIPVAKNAEASGTVIWVGTRHELLGNDSLLGAGSALPGEMCVPDGYVLRCAKVGRRDVLICAGYDARGCYYGLQTLIQLMSASGGSLSLPRVDITDWPSFRIRLVKTNASLDKPEIVKRWGDLLPRYKMNVLASQFHARGDSIAWNKPGKTFTENVATTAYASVTRDTFDPLLYLSPLGKNRGSLLDPKTVDEYADILCARIRQGYKFVAVDFNDWAKYKALSPEEQARFKDIGELMAWLTNQAYERVRSRYPEVGILAVPAAGYYDGQAKPQLVSFCKAIPRDVMVETTGPIVRSVKITADWLREWAAKTGRKPFLWDNTIYCHLDQLGPEFSGKYNLNAFEVSFPPDMPKLLAGPGIHLNGGARAWWEPGVLTFLDYMWNPEAYDPKTSLRNAQILLWGKDAPDAANDAREKTVVLYEYLSKELASKGTGSREEALAKLADIETAAKRLAGIIRDPVVTAELESDYLAKARATLTWVFPDPSAAQAGQTK